MLKFSLGDLLNFYFPQITRINTDEYVKKPVNICKIYGNLLMFLEKFSSPTLKGGKFLLTFVKTTLFWDGNLILMDFGEILNMLEIL